MTETEKLKQKIQDLKDACDFWQSLAEKRRLIIIDCLNALEYFQYHNKNLTKEQWHKISEMLASIYEQKKRS